MRRPIATALRLYRQAQGLKQSELAERMGVAQGMISRHEVGADDVKASTIDRYAQAYGLDPLDFLLAALALAKKHASEK